MECSLEGTMEYDGGSPYSIDLYVDLDKNEPLEQDSLHLPAEHHDVDVPVNENDDKTELSGLDLYSDILTSELQEKQQFEEKAFEDLQKLRAEHKILQEQLKVVNSTLEKMGRQNFVLKYNISALYKTAKAEIERKDSSIHELRERLDSIIFRRQRRQNLSLNENNIPEKLEDSCTTTDSRVDDEHPDSRDDKRKYHESSKKDDDERLHDRKQQKESSKTHVSRFSSINSMALKHRKHIQERVRKLGRHYSRCASDSSEIKTRLHALVEKRRENLKNSGKDDNCRKKEEDNKVRSSPMHKTVRSVIVKDARSKLNFKSRDSVERDYNQRKIHAVESNNKEKKSSNRHSTKMASGEHKDQDNTTISSKRSSRCTREGNDYIRKATNCKNKKEIDKTLHGKNVVVSKPKGDINIKRTNKYVDGSSKDTEEQRKRSSSLIIGTEKKNEMERTTDIGKDTGLTNLDNIERSSKYKEKESEYTQIKKPSSVKVDSKRKSAVNKIPESNMAMHESKQEIRKNKHTEENNIGRSITDKQRKEDNERSLFRGKESDYVQRKESNSSNVDSKKMYEVDKIQDLRNSTTMHKSKQEIMMPNEHTEQGSTLNECRDKPKKEDIEISEYKEKEGDYTARKDSSVLKDDLKKENSISDIRNNITIHESKQDRRQNKHTEDIGRSNEFINKQRKESSLVIFKKTGGRDEITYAGECEFLSKEYISKENEYMEENSYMNLNEGKELVSLVAGFEEKNETEKILNVGKIIATPELNEADIRPYEFTEKENDIERPNKHIKDKEHLKADYKKTNDESKTESSGLDAGKDIVLSKTKEDTKGKNKEESDYKLSDLNYDLGEPSSLKRVYFKNEMERIPCIGKVTVLPKAENDTKRSLKHPEEFSILEANSEKKYEIDKISDTENYINSHTLHQDIFKTNNNRGEANNIESLNKCTEEQRIESSLITDPRKNNEEIANTRSGISKLNEDIGRPGKYTEKENGNKVLIELTKEGKKEYIKVDKKKNEIEKTTNVREDLVLPKSKDVKSLLKDTEKKENDHIHRNKFSRLKSGSKEKNEISKRDKCADRRKDKSPHRYKQDTTSLRNGTEISNKYTDKQRKESIIADHKNEKDETTDIIHKLNEDINRPTEGSDKKRSNKHTEEKTKKRSSSDFKAVNEIERINKVKRDVPVQKSNQDITRSSKCTEENGKGNIKCSDIYTNEYRNEYLKVDSKKKNEVDAIIDARKDIVLKTKEYIKKSNRHTEEGNDKKRSSKYLEEQRKEFNNIRNEIEVITERDVMTKSKHTIKRSKKCTTEINDIERSNKHAEWRNLRKDNETEMISYTEKGTVSSKRKEDINGAFKYTKIDNDCGVQRNIFSTLDNYIKKSDVDKIIDIRKEGIPKSKGIKRSNKCTDGSHNKRSDKYTEKQRNEFDNSKIESKIKNELDSAIDVNKYITEHKPKDLKRSSKNEENDYIQRREPSSLKIDYKNEDEIVSVSHAKKDIIDPYSKSCVVSNKHIENEKTNNLKRKYDSTISDHKHSCKRECHTNDNIEKFKKHSKKNRSSRESVDSDSDNIKIATKFRNDKQSVMELKGESLPLTEVKGYKSCESVNEVKHRHNARWHKKLKTEKWSSENYPTTQNLTSHHKIVSCHKSHKKKHKKEKHHSKPECHARLPLSVESKEITDVNKNSKSEKIENNEKSEPKYRSEGELSTSDSDAC